QILLSVKKTARAASPTGPKNTKSEDKILPPFKVGESGEHVPESQEKMTQPPKYYTEATLLRGMETAGKQVEDDELRDLMKANGIGRPSTRANIIETLFRRKYLVCKRKQIHATDTGIQLIKVIDNELLKSPELTGQWEKQLSDIAKGEHRPQQFVHDMKMMLEALVKEVGGRTVYSSEMVVGSQGRGQKTDRYADRGQKKATSASTANSKSKRRNAKPALVGHSCPKCQQGQLLKGKAAFGCSQYKSGCDFRLPFKFMGKKMPEKQLLRLLEYGTTIQLKGFKREKVKVNGQVRFDDNFAVVLKEKGKKVGSSELVVGSTQRDQPRASNSKLARAASPTPSFTCPKCQTGKMLKGKTAYGCSRYREGCDFRVAFATVREEAKGRKITRELVAEIIKSSFLTAS
ncbi:MAG: DNA topoisomerase, partial [Saprospiraceae bacterium]